MTRKELINELYRIKEEIACCRDVGDKAQEHAYYSVDDAIDHLEENEYYEEDED